MLVMILLSYSHQSFEKAFIHRSYRYESKYDSKMRVTFTLTMPHTKTGPLSSDIQYIIYYYQKY